MLSPGAYTFAGIVVHFRTQAGQIRASSDRSAQAPGLNRGVSDGRAYPLAVPGALAACPTRAQDTKSAQRDAVRRSLGLPYVSRMSCICWAPAALVDLVCI